GIEHRGSGGSADGVVAQRDEFVIEHAALAQASDENSHSIFTLGIAARLRTILLIHINDRTRRRARQAYLLRASTKSAHRADQFRFGGLSLELDGDGQRVAVDHGDAITARTHFSAEWLDPPGEI